MKDWVYVLDIEYVKRCDEKEEPPCNRSTLYNECVRGVICLSDAYKAAIEAFYTKHPRELLKSVSYNEIATQYENQDALNTMLKELKSVL